MEKRWMRLLSGALAALCLAGCLSACSLSDLTQFISEAEKQRQKTSVRSNETTALTQPETTAPATAPAFTVTFDPEENFGTVAEREASKRVDASICRAVEALNEALAWSQFFTPEIQNSPGRKNYRATLGSEEKQLYDEMKAAMEAFAPLSYNPREHGDRPPFENAFVTKLLSARQALFYDETRLFLYADLSSSGGLEYLCYYRPNDWLEETTDLEALKEAVALFDAVCDRILRKMPEGLSNTQKAYYFARVMADMTSYDYSQKSLWATFQPYECLVNGLCVCQGYARALQYLMRLAGIEIACVEGQAPGGGDHMWNLVSTDEGNYYIDVTWCDGERSFANQYFMMSEEVLLDYEGYEPSGEADY